MQVAGATIIVISLSKCCCFRGSFHGRNYGRKPNPPPNPLKGRTKLKKGGKCTNEGKKNISRTLVPSVPASRAVSPTGGMHVSPMGNAEGNNYPSVGNSKAGPMCALHKERAPNDSGPTREKIDLIVTDSIKDGNETPIAKKVAFMVRHEVMTEALNEGLIVPDHGTCTSRMDT